LTSHCLDSHLLRDLIVHKVRHALSLKYGCYISNEQLTTCAARCSPSVAKSPSPSATSGSVMSSSFTLGPDVDSARRARPETRTCATTTTSSRYARRETPITMATTRWRHRQVADWLTFKWANIIIIRARLTNEACICHFVHMSNVYYCARLFIINDNNYEWTRAIIFYR